MSPSRSVHPYRFCGKRHCMDESETSKREISSTPSFTLSAWTPMCQVTKLSWGVGTKQSQRSMIQGKNHFYLELTKDLGYRRLQTAALLVADLAGSHSPHPSRLDDGDCCRGCWRYSEHCYRCRCWSSGCWRGPRTPQFPCLRSDLLEHSPRARQNHVLKPFTPSLHETIYIALYLCNAFTYAHRTSFKARSTSSKENLLLCLIYRWDERGKRAAQRHGTR